MALAHILVVVYTSPLAVIGTRPKPGDQYRRPALQDINEADETLQD